MDVERKWWRVLETIDKDFLIKTDMAAESRSGLSQRSTSQRRQKKTQTAADSNKIRDEKQLRSMEKKVDSFSHKQKDRHKQTQVQNRRVTEGQNQRDEEGKKES